MNFTEYRNPGRHREHLPKHYSIAKVSRRFAELYHVEIRKIQPFYKSCARYAAYDLYDMDTNKQVASGVHLYTLGKFLDDKGFY